MHSRNAPGDLGLQASRLLFRRPASRGTTFQVHDAVFALIPTQNDVYKYEKAPSRMKKTPTSALHGPSLLLSISPPRPVFWPGSSIFSFHHASPRLCKTPL